MAYSAVWDETAPLGTAAANTIDDIFRSGKRDLRERLADAFDLPSASAASFAVDPFRLYGLKFTSLAASTIYLGNNGGTPWSLSVKDSTGTDVYLFLSSNTLVYGKNAAAVSASISVNGAAGQNRVFGALTNGTNRWQWGAGTSAEGGADAGSQFVLSAFTDAGALIDSPISITRAAAGTVTFVRPVLVVGADALATSAQVLVKAAAGQTRQYVFNTASTSRWSLRVSNTAEGGADAGSNFAIDAFTDAGVFLDSPISINRVTGGTFQTPRPFAATGGLITSGGAALAATAEFRLNTAAGQLRSLSWLTATVNRWQMRVNNTAEGGSDAGSDFQLLAYTDGGANIDVPIAITRAAAGLIVFNRNVVIGTTPSTAGNLRLPNNTTIGWRNAANSANITFGLNNADTFTVGATINVTGGVTVTTAFVGPGTAATANAVRLANADGIAWRNAANSANISLLLNASDVLITTAASFSIGTTPAAAGGIRIPNTTTVAWRNAANSADKTIVLDNTDIFQINSPVNVTGSITISTTIIGPGTVSSAGVVRLANAAQIGWRNFANSADVTMTVTNADLFSLTGGISSTGNISGVNFSSTGSIKSTSASGGIGYNTGAGNNAVQATNKATTVAFNAVCGQITMNGAALAAATIVSFTFTNTSIAATDMLLINHVSGGTPGSYTLNAQCAAGSAIINVRNNTAGSLSEAIVLLFAVIKGVTS